MHPQAVTANPPPIHKAHIEHLERISPDVLLLRMRLARSIPFEFKAGQYLSIHLPNGELRCYSMARAWQHGECLELHIRVIPGGRFSGWLVDQLHGTQGKRAQISISGPYGNCTWFPTPQIHAETLMLATGTGIAPISALLEFALSSGVTSPITLYWGARWPEDLYMSSHFEYLAQAHPNFQYRPVLSVAHQGWLGQFGRVQQCAASDHPRLQNSRVYACGSPAMVSDARSLLTTQCGLDPDCFHADAFEPAAKAIGEQHGGHVTVRVRTDQSASPTRLVALPVQTSLMQSLQQIGLLSGVCGGHASCGACRIGVESSWLERLPSPDRVEARLLASLEGADPTDRLACQIILNVAMDGLCIVLPKNFYSLPQPTSEMKG